MMSSSSGLFLNKTKFIVVNENPVTTARYVKGKGCGGCIVKTNQCILVGIYVEGADNRQTKTACNRDVEDLAEKLKSVGY